MASSNLSIAVLVSLCGTDFEDVSSPVSVILCVCLSVSPFFLGTGLLHVLTSLQDVKRLVLFQYGQVLTC